MKVVRKGKCDSGPVTMNVDDIPLGTVFSGRLSYGSEVMLLRGSSSRVILLSDCDNTVSGSSWTNQPIIKDYKELNAYLCIEE